MPQIVRSNDNQSKQDSMPSISNRSLLNLSLSNVHMTHSPLNITMYANDYTHGQPDSQQSKRIRHETFQRFASTRQRRLLSQRFEQSASVASCMNWHDNRKECVTSPTNNTTAIDSVLPIVSSSSSLSPPSVTGEQTDKGQVHFSTTMPTLPATDYTRTRTPDSTHFFMPKLTRSITSLEPDHRHEIKELVSKYM
jgi:hypothetical protein